MTHFLMEYGLFLAKTITLVLALLIALSAILAMRQRASAQDGMLVISNINQKMEELRLSLQSETLSKEEHKKWLKAQKKEAKALKKEKRNRLFIIQFDGDIRASQVIQLKEIVSAILEIADLNDEVLVNLESAGGFVHAYGLASSQLDRIRQRNLPLTVSIDKFAASGGYMMACVANQIIAAPFSIVGSIGVLAQMPNFHRLLEKHNIDFEQLTAGEYKRTLSIFGENTDKARQKFQEELEETHTLFKQHIQRHRPQVAIEQVATGEHWHGITAINFRLVDKIQTSDDFILEKVKTHQVFEVSYEVKQKLLEKITSNLFATAHQYLLKLLALRPRQLVG